MKTLIGMLMGLSLLLAGCGSTGGLTKDQIDALVAKIQEQCAAVCSYQPAAANVASLIAAFYPAGAPFVEAANAVTKAICESPITSSAIRRGVVLQTRIVQTPKGPVAVQGTPYR